MEIKVRLFIDNKLVEPSELSKIVIKNPNVDRIVNDIVDRKNNPKKADALSKVS